MDGGVLAQIAKGGFHIPPAANTSLAGVVVGDVELDCLLAGGATSDVWKGRRVSDGLPVAVKIACRKDDDGLKARFDHEVKLLENVLAPRRVEGSPPYQDAEVPEPESPFPRYYGSGEFQGHPYIVTELLSPIEIPEDDREFRRLFLEIVEAVGVLHARGYIHQDLKPGNIMRRQESGRIVLIDFGQAHRIEEGRLLPRMDSLTLDSMGRRTATGTAGYCAPEQLDSERTAFLPATDVYALGMLIRNFRSGIPFWNSVGNDATDPDLRRRIPDTEVLTRQVMRLERANHINAVEVLLSESQSRLERRGGLVPMTWEKLVSLDLGHRRRMVQLRSQMGRSAHPEKSVLTMEELGGKLPGLGIGVEEYGPLRIHAMVGSRYTLKAPIHFTDSLFVRLFGTGALELDASADGDVVFMVGRDCTLVNDATLQTGIEYFVNDGGFLCFPNIPESESLELRKHIHLASFNGAFVQFGNGRTREEINESYQKDWEAAIATGDSKVFSMLRSSRLSQPDRGTPVVLRRR